MRLGASAPTAPFWLRSRLNCRGEFVLSSGLLLSKISVDAMPLYDLVLMVKKGVEKRSVVELLSNLGQRVYTTRGVVTDVKSFGRVNLAYPIKKRDGRHHEAQMLQMTLMVATNFGDQLKQLNQDERLLRWLIVKSRGDGWLRGPSAS